jgi:hypothetical protein
MSPLGQGLIIAAFGAVLAAILGTLGWMAQRVGKLITDVTTLQTQMSPFWASVERIVSKDLHHPNVRYAEMDTLLEKLEALTITLEERERLKILLVERSEDQHQDITEDQRKKASLMVPLMELVLEEAKDKKE